MRLSRQITEGYSAKLSIPALPKMFTGMPAHDAEPVLHGSLHPAPVEAAVRTALNADEPRGGRVARRHGRQQPGDLVDIAHQLGGRRDIPAAKPEPDGRASNEVQLPLTAAGGQQGVTVPYIAHRLPVCLTAPAADHECEHQVAPERRRDWQPEDEPHWHVDHTEETRLQPAAQWWS